MASFSVILTAAREAGTIEKALESILNPSFCGADWSKGELLLIAPDDLTLNTAKSFINKNYHTVAVNYIQDPYQGKPTALNLGFEQAKGEYIVLTDGDVFLGKNSLKYLLDAFTFHPNIGGVTGRPVSSDSKNNLFAYLGNLLADAAHHKRIASMRRDVGGKSLNLVGKGPGFFVMSGYVSAIKNLDLRIPADTLVDDAYLSYLLINKGLDITYSPDATAYVKYPKNLHDWYTQKVRSVGGYMQLYKYNIVPAGKKVRNFWKELEYFWFPITYAKSFKEFIWSLALYPLRLYMWLRIFWEQKIRKREYYRGWERVESTK